MGPTTDDARAPHLRGTRLPWWYSAPDELPLDVLRWVDTALLAQGRVRTAPVTLTHARPWSAVARVETDAGTAHLKACSRGTAHEVDVLRVLAREVPDRVVAPLAADRGRGLLLLPDGGPLLGDMEGARGGRTVGESLSFAAPGAPVPTSHTTPGTLAVDLAERPPWALGLARGLASAAQVQRSTSHVVDELLAAGVPDMRPARLLERFDEALEAAASRADAARSTWLGDVVEHLREVRPQVADECAELAGLAVGPAIDHDDLHPWNLLRPERPGRAPLPIDWGDAVVSHPFVVLLVPLRARRRRTDDEDGVVELRRAYLGQWRDVAPMFELRRAADLACRLGSIVRAHAWLRILEATDNARGSAVEPGTVTAGGGRPSGDLVPLLWLRNLVLPSYLGALTAQG